MSRYGRKQSYGHSVRYICPDVYRMRWTLDLYRADSMLRYPTGYTRDTDRAGAERFAKRWGVEIKGEPIKDNE